LYGDLWNLPAGPISFAISSEHRSEHATVQPDALAASGDTASPDPANFLPTKGSRDVWSIYWEVRVPVTSPTWHCFGLYCMELGYQERYDNYSDFGSTEKPKFFFRWQPIDSSLTLRGTYNEAFHAPALYELFTSPFHDTTLVDDPATVLPGDPLGRPPGTSLTSPDARIKETLGGNPNLRPETAYEWTYGAVLTLGKWWNPLQGLTLQADFYHIDLRNVIVDRDANTILANNFDTRTGTLPNGAPTGGIFSDLIQRDSMTGAVLNVNAGLQNVSRIITEGLDYEASYQLDTSIFDRGNFGTFTFTFNGNYLDRFVRQATPESPKLNDADRFRGPRLGSFPRNRWYISLFYDGPAGSWLGGLDAGALVHYIGQYWDNIGVTTFDGNKSRRKIREWTTLDLIVNYTFNLPASAAPNEVAGYARDGGKNTESKDGKGKSVMPVSTVAYNPCGWRAWLSNTTITLAVNNVFDFSPPFVAGNFENGYDQRAANIRGRVWFVALTKRF
jgi:outer membrane receptor protein involved in Fe transport